MADLIQFNCPACATSLRLPIDMAGSEGPCPYCSREIVAPEPSRGIGAYEIEVLPLPAQVEPFKPFAESPPVVYNPNVSENPARFEMAHERVPLPEPVRQHPEPLQEYAEPERTAPIHNESQPTHFFPYKSHPGTIQQTATLVLSVLLTAFVSLLAGYYLGLRSNLIVSGTPPVVLKPNSGGGDAPEPPTVKSQTDTVPAAVAAEPAINRTKPAPAPQPEKKPEPVKASVAAQSALRAFLSAPDWLARSSFVIAPDKIRASMEKYAAQTSDGPTPFKSISVVGSRTDRKTGGILFDFQVVTDSHPAGIPATVMETESGWRVDWKSFVEFRDGHFKKFVDEAPAGQTARFHLQVTTPPAERAAKTDNEFFAPFLLDPPMSGCQRIAYARKSSDIHMALKAATANGAVFTPFLEIAKNRTPDGKDYLEIVKILENDWQPEER